MGSGIACKSLGRGYFHFLDVTTYIRSRGILELPDEPLGQGSLRAEILMPLHLSPGFGAEPCREGQNSGARWRASWVGGIQADRGLHDLL